MEYQAQKIKYISHEIKNQLSICDLYTEILQRYCKKNCIEDETITKSIQNIKLALQLSGNSLLELKTVDCTNVEECSFEELLKSSYDLAKVYANNKNITMNLTSNIKTNILADKNKFTAIVINLVKNACEAFKEEPEKVINISTSQSDKFIKIKISNNATPIKEPDKIFQDGVTTKQTGSGLGLYISKQNALDMLGDLILLKSDEISTDFELRVKSV